MSLISEWTHIDHARRKVEWPRGYDADSCMQIFARKPLTSQELCRIN
jgi:hypothetical protein